MEDRKIIGITMGDPASIGPEITVKALADQSIYEACRPIVVGDACVLEAALKIAGHEEMKVRAVKDVRDAVFTHGTIDVLDMGLVSMDELVRGQVSAMCGDAAFRYVEKVIELAMDGQVDATVTNAFNKEAVNLAGHHYSGHTEIYADLTGTKNYTMMLAHENMRVVHVSTHVSLREACDRVKKQRVLDVIRIGDKACREMGIEAARAEGIRAEGPVPPDTVFSKARGGWYDIVVAMYHDQGHIPLKVVGFVYDQEKQAWDAVAGVNITLGLPIIRVSVDHGTAFDQAGTGTASELSLKNSLEYAVMFARNRKQQRV